MKSLFLVRHAKSSWDDYKLSDHDRPLMRVGIKKTGRIIKFLQEKQVRPDLLISSSATRAMETAKLMAKGLSYPVQDIQIESELYHASIDSIFSLLSGLSNTLDQVMIFGHNPTFTYFANQYIKPELDNLPTSGVVRIDYNVDEWNALPLADTEVSMIVFPRMLK